MAKQTAMMKWSSTARAALGCLVIVLGGLPSWVAAAPASDHERTLRRDLPSALVIAVGEQRQIAPGQRLVRVALGDPSVADVLVVRDGDGRGGVLMIGKAPGKTNLLLWERGRVAPQTLELAVVPGAQATLANEATPHVETFGGDVVVSGDTPTAETHQRGRDLADLAANGSAHMSEPSDDPKTGAARAHGQRAGGDAIIVDESTVATRSVVQVDVRVVEFSRTVLKQAGLNLFKQTNGFSFGTSAPSGLNSVSGGGTSNFQLAANTPIASAFNLVLNSAGRGLFADLSLMESNNLARVLAEPTLVALSGQSASFLAGGEIPVPVPQALGTTSIEYKPYGVGLTLTPTVLSPRRIALKVAPEASQLDFQNAVTINGVSVPAITTRRTDTTVELGDGESFVIGGLIDRETLSNVSKVPLLGDLPVIGTFFKQLNYQQNDKELVIVVTPHLVSPLAKDAPLPSTPGEQAEQRDGPVWRSYLGGALSRDAGPGFSR